MLKYLLAGQGCAYLTNYTDIIDKATPKIAHCWLFFKQN
jgi:hypothetical protein